MTDKPDQQEGKTHWAEGEAVAESHISAEADISGGESTPEERKVAKTALDWDHWKFQWTNWLTMGVTGVAAVYFVAFLAYALWGDHELPDIPVIIALASIPTILTVSLMRFFHSNGKDESSEMPGPTQIEMIAKIVDMVISKIKG